MEKHIQLKSFFTRKIIFPFIFLFLVNSLFFPQSTSLIEHIRIPLWASLDAYPELIENSKNQNQLKQFDFPISQMKQLSVLLISGMVYGWEFSYTPSDKMRNVDEYFELTEQIPQDYFNQKIHYDSPFIENQNLNCWCEYSRTQNEVKSYYLWSSIQNQVISNKGYGKITKGFSGIQDAIKDCAKNAIRQHYRNVIKNKPKEITGRILIKSQPILAIDNGQYVINLDFFLEYGKIKEYKVY